MSIARNMSYFVMVFVFIGIGCVHIPTSEHPIEIEKSFNASFDSVWNSVLKIVENSQGNIITEDKSSGLIVYSIFDNESRSQIYMQVYLQNFPHTNITVVRSIPKIRNGYYLKETKRDFFETLEKNMVTE